MEDALIEKITREDQRIAKGSVNLFKKLSRSLGAGKKVVEISFSKSDEPLPLPTKVGEIPFTKVGTHRRIKISDLIAYQKTLKATRKKQLKFLAKQAQELKLDY